MGFVVAVDGPAGSGKGTITKKIAKEMNLTSIDTGAMYRSVPSKLSSAIFNSIKKSLAMHFIF